MEKPIPNPECSSAGAESAVSESGRAVSTYRLEHVSDSELLVSTRRLVGRSNEVLAALLAHLAEVEQRGIHRLRSCASLYTYCVFELRLSEDAAFRRARAARVARQFPTIFQQVAAGELHLTAIVLLAPHLTEENHRGLLALAKHRTKREILRIVRTLAPEPSVPDRVEPLGPEPIGIPIPRVPSWRSLVESLAPAVRELSPGDRPRDWIDDMDNAGADPVREGVELPVNLETLDAGAGVEAGASPQRYRIQFTASQAYADLLERARDLLSHAVPDRSLEEVHVRALRLLVEQLEKRKYGAPRRTPTADPSNSGTANAVEPSDPGTANAAEPSRKQQQRARRSKERAHQSRRRGSAAERREVRDRDGNQCTFVDEFGTRCRETAFLELHHELAHALGGDPVATNLTIRCQAHNALAAERDFGREFMKQHFGKRPRKRRIAERPPP